MTSNVRIRPVKEGEVLRVVALAKEFMPGETDDRFRASILERNMKDPRYRVIVAEVNGELVGFIDCWFIYDFCHGGVLGYIQNLYVKPSFRRRGIGGGLLRKLLSIARKLGALELHVATDLRNEPAIKLYEKYGFKRCGLQLEIELR